MHSKFLRYAFHHALEFQKKRMNKYFKKKQRCNSSVGRRITEMACAARNARLFGLGHLGYFDTQTLPLVLDGATGLGAGYRNGGFLSHGGTPKKSSILDWDFPFKTNQLYGIPHLWNTHMFLEREWLGSVWCKGSMSRSVFSSEACPTSGKWTWNS